MYRIRIFGKFLLWLLKQIFHWPLTFLAYTHIFIDSWKKECRRDFGLAMLFYLLTTTCCMISGLVCILIIYGEEATKPMLTSSIFTSFIVSTGLFVFTILLASYDKFIEEYEQSFTKLKE
mgnify:CR=1 FL=1